MAVARRSFRRYASYRGATVAGVFTNTVFGFVFASVFAAVHDAVGDVDGVTSDQTVTFIFGAQAFLMMTGAFGDREISDRIRTGDIAADLYRPVDFQLWWLANDYGKAAFLAIGRGVPPFAAGMIALDLPWPGGWSTWSAFLVAAFSGVTLAFSIRFIANLAGFWLLDGRGVVALLGLVQMFFAGHIVPLYFMPDGLERLARALPFAGITAHPIEILLGIRRGWDVMVVFAHQLAWIAVLIIVGRTVLERARRRLVIQGG